MNCGTKLRTRFLCLDKQNRENLIFVHSALFSLLSLTTRHPDHHSKPRRSKKYTSKKINPSPQPGPQHALFLRRPPHNHQSPHQSHQPGIHAPASDTGSPQRRSTGSPCPSFPDSPSACRSDPAWSLTPDLLLSRTWRPTRFSYSQPRQSFSPTH